MSLSERNDDSPPETSTDALQATFERLHDLSRTQAAPDDHARVAALRRLEAAVRARRDDFADAIATDFGHRAAVETMLADVFVAVGATRHARQRLRRWMKPRRRSVGLHFLPARARLLPQPLGLVGIISPWNYPVNLALAPLAAAIAAGNRVMVKPSELTPVTAALLADVLGRVFSPDEVVVVTGGAGIGAAFSALPFDHLLFTGSTSIGRRVMQAAAQNLTPVTLELGGKSPALIAPQTDLSRAVKSIVHGKLFNAGQTCIAPDYVLLPRGDVARFVDEALAAARAYYPQIAGNEDYTSIVNPGHWQRLQDLLEDARANGAQVAAAAETVADERRLPLSLVLDANDAMKVMQEEIFGPVLPVIPYDTIDDAITYINGRDRPLALYLFDDDRRRIRDVLARTWSGGVTVNDTLLHAGIEDLPFGGIGASGIGRYHGRAGFDTFSHLKPVLLQSRFNGTWMMRPPYGARVRGLLRFLLGR